MKAKVTNRGCTVLYRFDDYSCIWNLKEAQMISSSSKFLGKDKLEMMQQLVQELYQKE